MRLCYALLLASLVACGSSTGYGGNSPPPAPPPPAPPAPGTAVVPNPGYQINPQTTTIASGAPSVGSGAPSIITARSASLSAVGGSALTNGIIASGKRA